MALDDTIGLLFRIRADSSDAAADADRLKNALGDSFSSIGAAAQNLNRNSAASFEAGLVSALRSAGREGEGLFVVLTQLRIGLTQLGRGDIGGVPNLIRAYREFAGVGSEAKRALQVLDAAFVSSGVKVTNAGERLEEFRDKVARALSGSDKRARELQAAFAQLGINLTNALLRPDQAFAQLLKGFGSAQQGSAEFAAGLELLGLNAGKASNAAQIAGRSLTQLSSGFGGLSTATIAAGGAIVAALLAAGAVTLALVKGTEKVIETARQVGTKSRDDFEEFRKRVEAAGFSVTAADRAISQGLVRALDRVKGATEGLFVQLVRQTGPNLINLLNDVSGLIKDLTPQAQSFGKFLADSFDIARLALRDLKEAFNGLGDLLPGIKLDFREFFIDLIVFVREAVFELNKLGSGINNLDQALTPSGFDFERLKQSGRDFADALKGNVAGIRAEVEAELKTFRDEAEKTRKSQPKATFDSDGGRKSAESATQTKLRLLEIEERAAQRVFNEEARAAERAFTLRLINGDELTRRLIAAEEKLLGAKLRTIDAEREAIDKGDLKDGKAQIKRAELRERELQALSDYHAKVQKLQDDQAKRQSDGINQTLDDLRKVAEARARLNRELFGLAVERRRIELDALDQTIAELERIPTRRGELAEARTRREIETERLRHDQALAAIEDQRRENELSARTAEEKNRIQEQLNLIEESETARHAQALAAIRHNLQAELERQNPLSARSFFGDDFADALDRGESRLQAFGEMFTGIAQSIAGSITPLSQILVGAVNNLANGVGSLVSQYVTLGTTGPAALRKLLAATIAAVAQEAAVNAVKALATAFFLLATGDFSGAGQAFISAALWGSLAGGAALAGRAVAGDAFQQGAGASAAAGAFSGSQVRPTNQTTFQRGDVNGQVGGDRDVIVGSDGRLYKVENPTSLHSVMNKLADAHALLASKVAGMSPGDVLTAGAQQNPRAVGSAVIQHANEDSGFTQTLGLRLGLG